MQPELYRARSMSGALAAVRAALGDDAAIIETRGPDETDGLHYEVLALPEGWEEAKELARPGGPLVVALVGPPGAGKTTTLVKLALHPAAFGGRRVGLLNLDTWRAGAIEQLDTFAAIAGLPLESAFDAADTQRALDRLADCDVVLVDTPGRGLNGGSDIEWQAALRAAGPREVHLVMAATCRADYAARTRERLRRCGLTHALVTMIDELPARAGIGELRSALALPLRWTAAGPNVPDDLTATTTGRASTRKVTVA